MLVEKICTAVVALCWVALGRVELACILGDFIWDFMPASLLVEEAGGKFTTTDGKAVDYLKIANHCILATDGIIHNKVLELVKGNISE